MAKSCCLEHLEAGHLGVGRPQNSPSHVVSNMDLSGEHFNQDDELIQDMLN